jgi:choline dehydrogenase-like flavoprotein
MYPRRGYQQGLGRQMPATKIYDALVIGSGITGGWAAKELTEKGLNVLLLEAGRNIVPEVDYVEHVPSWELKYRGWDNREERLKTQPVQREVYYACDEFSHKFFVNDLENPYTTDPGKPFTWIRGRQVGGKSITWGRQSYRFSDLDFEANLRDGIATDWPIRYKDIEPWYDYVEDFIGVSGQAEGLPQLPDGKFLPPMEMSCAEHVVREALPKNFDDGRKMTIGRTAILTQVHRGRAACHYCGVCHRGCITRSYFSSLNSTLPAAEKTGRLTLRPHSVVSSLIFDPATRKVTGVHAIDGQTKQSLEFHGRIVFVCASALESARLLLNSSTSEFPNGLANSSGELGHNIMDHIMGGGADGVIPGNEDKDEFGNRPNGIYVPRFRNIKTKQPFLRGYGYQGGGYREGWGRGMNATGFGADFKKALRKPGAWHFSFYGFGECLPNHDNYLEINPDVKDAWGIPTIKIHAGYGENEKALLHDMAAQASEMLAAAGATEIHPFMEANAMGLAIHEMGTARMGKDPKTSVVNEHNQAHDAKNLFMTDGACMVSSACVNPSLTYMALTARACDFAVSAMKRNEL